MSAARRLLAVADALPVTVLAAIAGAGSFTQRAAISGSPVTGVNVYSCSLVKGR